MRLTKKADNEKLTEIGVRYTSKDSSVKLFDVVNKLGELEDLLEQGRLMELPCAVGDTVWELHAVDDFYAVAPHRINSLAYCMLTKDRFGESVFLTKEEAEAKLAELKGE